MKIERLDGSGVRNLQPFSLHPGRVNVLAGANGSGKSSLLESIHILSGGRSFRTSRLDGVITTGAPELTVFAMGRDDVANENRIGFRKRRSGEVEVHLNGSAALGSRVASLLPSRFIGPGSEELIDGEPAQRRSFLDWILFHVEHSYLQLWRRANRGLAQRNALLKRNASEQELAPWTAELLEASRTIAALRAEAASLLEEHAANLLHELGLDNRFDCQFVTHVIPESANEWAELSGRERALGYSLFGFQRDDLKFRVSGGSAKEVLSRGQKKVLVYALQLAESALVQRKTGKMCALLVDDPCSELDRDNAAKIITAIERTQMQVFITAVEASVISECLSSPHAATMFHVEHGVISSRP